MECLGEIINIFVSIVVNTTLKSITGVNDVKIKIEIY